ncbi:ABC transporter substrate-binding protein [Burkholderia diffusa]|uniref:ABC transporter substrate-binding protein n=1 Tax=Burkholderia diffusa TaxID=488732 RepID=UPI00157A5C32|nr:ABC transporter substrate-binding protein [Burkholderia diffusa]NTY38041.1 amino acid ABC transporter substrate-binding protein [Burkholderia diffusa]
MAKRIHRIIALATLFAAAISGPAVAQQTLTVGTETNGVPFSFLSPATQKMQGFMVDLIEAVGKRAGFKPIVQPMDFSALIPALTSHKIDIIASSMYITDKRKQVIAFTNPVYTYGEGMVVPASDGKTYTSYQEFKGHVIGAQVGTVYGDTLKSAGVFKDVKIYDTIPGIISDVNAGRIDAGIADYPTLAYYLGQGQFPGTRLVKSYKTSIPGSIGLGLRQDDKALNQKLQAALDQLNSDGELAAMRKKWNLD